jgi:UDP-galactopyranose mutase
MDTNFDYLIVGAGLSGIVLAERISTQLNKTSIIIDKRNHIGGNCYDEYDECGLLVHTYGPHYFRTNSDRIVQHISQFTNWKNAKYNVRSYTDGKYWSFPINLHTFEQLIGRKSTEHEFIEYLSKSKVPIENPKNSEEVIISQVGYELFEKFFRGYTRKQWKMEPKELDASVCGRIPIRTNYDDRYFSDKFQALPSEGYTKMFEKMLRAAKHTKVLLSTDYREIKKFIKFKHIIFTGAIDEYYNYNFGRLPYRSLRFERESFNPSQLKARSSISNSINFWQPSLQVNYPNDHDYTRIIELKHVTKQQSDHTTIVREYPMDYNLDSIPYYPVPTPSSQLLYQKYLERSKIEKNVSFVGRLATYKYYNMDQVIGMALTEFDKLQTNARNHMPSI